jgi:formamidopyrimidine-DNA glycosylase
VPELPEVETVRRDLVAVLPGSTITRVEVTGARSVRRQDASVFAGALTGRSVTSVGRWGKYLLIELDGPAGAVLVVHLRMSGQLLLAGSPGVELAKHSHVRLTLADGRELRFVDPRTFGEMFVTSPDLPELAGMGIDAVDPALTPDAFAELLGARRARLKPLLLDQRVVAGIGNIYSDEILWTSRLRWYRPAAALRPVEVGRLHSAVHQVLTEAIDARGSSLYDGQYVDLSGQPGQFQEHHEVYARLGQPCRRCGRLIERTTVAQRSHFWCRGCQR